MFKIILSPIILNGILHLFEHPAIHIYTVKTQSSQILQQSQFPIHHRHRKTDLPLFSIFIFIFPIKLKPPPLPLQSCPAAMDREQEEMQFLGFFGILKESWKILTTWPKIFSQITLSLIVPLASIYLAHIQISHLLFSHILLNQDALDRTPPGSKARRRISDVLSTELLTFALFKAAYLVFFAVLALISTAAAVYTIACIYTAREVSLRRVITVVPKVWRRLLATFAWNFLIVFAYNVVSFLLLAAAAFALFAAPAAAAAAFLAVFAALYLAGLFYISLIWQLASVVSVLEERYGLAAMAKSRALIRGKMGISFAVFFVLGLCFVGIQVAFEVLVVVGGGGGRGVAARVGYGILLVVAMAAVMAVGLVVQTVVYFVCKSYHHENIDKSSLADHLGGYLGEYVPLKSKDVQLENFEV
ncbi:uncharacterized protein LOC127248509 [Andrographis paniculata]|uniref:uncharacterized protein LOC127248509 n=1 Tax=Andrographis paniculata TaxID=175694 RepID=UPI0021E73E8C|nr:uncharacterized protein LOC127248509 [Andrographis paniculata]